LKKNIFRSIFLFLFFLAIVFSIISIKFVKFPLKSLIEASLIEKGLPFIIILMVVMSLRKEKYVERKIFISIFGCFSFLLLVKIFLNVHSYHYGVFLASPGIILVSTLIFKLLPSIARSRGNLQVLRMYAVVLIVFYIGANLQLSVKMYSLKNFLIGKGRNSFYYYLNQEGVCINETIKALEKTLKPDDRFVCFPEGVMLNFLLEKKTGIPYYKFDPASICIFCENNIISALKRSPPDYALLIGITAEEQGYVAFGKDYGRNIFIWLKENYLPVRLIGYYPFQNKNQFGILILKKRYNNKQ
jgi:hypothetical protein